MIGEGRVCGKWTYTVIRCIPHTDSAHPPALGTTTTCIQQRPPIFQQSIARATKHSEPPIMPNAESLPTEDASIHRCGVLNGLERWLVQQLGELETEQSTRGWILDRELENGFEWSGVLERRPA